MFCPGGLLPGCCCAGNSPHANAKMRMESPIARLQRVDTEPAKDRKFESIERMFPLLASISPLIVAVTTFYSQITRRMRSGAVVGRRRIVFLQCPEFRVHLAANQVKIQIAKL